MSKLSPKLQKMVDKSAPDFSRKLYFNKRFRQTVRADFTKIMETGLKEIENISTPTTLKESQYKLLAEQFLDLATKYLKSCDSADKKQKYYNQRGKFALYQRGKVYVFKTKTIRSKKLKEGNLYFEKGLPEKTIKSAYLKKEIVDLIGYTLLDGGKYHMKQTDFYNGYYHFWGNKKKYFINFAMQKGSTRKLILLKCEKSNY